MSAVKRKLTNKSLKKCEIIPYIEKGMPNKEAYEKFGVPKNTISMGMKCGALKSKIGNRGNTEGK